MPTLAVIISVKDFLTEFGLSAPIAVPISDPGTIISCQSGIITNNISTNSISFDKIGKNMMLFDKAVTRNFRNIVFDMTSPSINRRIEGCKGALEAILVSLKNKAADNINNPCRDLDARGDGLYVRKLTDGKPSFYTTYSTTSGNTVAKTHNYYNPKYDCHEIRGAVD